MPRLPWLALCALAACSAPDPHAAPLPATPRDPSRPNVLFVYLDDFGWRDAGFMGSDFFETPHLDALAAESVVFTQAYSCAANCAPARASLMTGQYTPRHKIYNVGRGPRGDARFRRLLHVPGEDRLAPGATTIASHLQAAGYTTGILGKWHLGDDPRGHGFDHNVGGTRSGSPPKGYYPPHPVPGLEDAPPDEYLTDRLTDEAVRFVESHREGPWFLYLSHFAVHTPLHAKRELVAKYRAKPPGTLHDHVAMATMIEAVDTGVGRLLATLDRLGLRENTIVVFSSDNGGLARATDMAPLRGYKGTYYEGGIRVPFFVHWPERLRARTSDVPITGVDVFPTLCGLTGVPLPEAVPLDGIDLTTCLAGDDVPAERALFWHFPAYLEASGKGPFESRDSLFRTRPCSVIRLGRWKLHQFFEDQDYELYDLENDIGETTDVSEREPDVVADLAGRLSAWHVRSGADLPVAPNPDHDPEAEAANRR